MNIKYLFKPSVDHFAVHSPAQVRGEHVEHFILADDRMERCSVGSINHVALIRCPPIQRAVRMHKNSNQCVLYIFKNQGVAGI